jgi:predicted phage-related endonuclease
MGNIVNEPLKVVHITDRVEVINVDYLGDKWVEETVRKYYAGEKVAQKPETELQTIDKNTVEKFSNALKQIALLEKEIEPIREQIKAEMEKRGILALKLGEVNISYVAPTKRKTFDTRRFKAENADIYEQYTKESEVKSSIRIKVD